MANRPPARTDVNRSAVLAHLGAQGAASRADLARFLNVSPALMTQLVKDLIADGLVQELDVAPSGGGRPARLLGLVSSAGRAVGAKIAPDHIAFVEMEIDGSVRRSASEPYDARSSSYLADLVALFHDFVDRSDDSTLLGVGVGVSGSVNRRDIGLVESEEFDWHQAPIGATLRRELGLPVLIENNVNALAVAERLYGMGRQHDDFLVLTIGTGVGAGFVVDGSVLRGHSGGAGEIGHLPVQYTGGILGAAGLHPLETLIGEGALVQAARRQGIIPERTGMAGLLAAANAGDSKAASVFAAAGHLLGLALAGVVHVLDPEIVLVLGEGVAAWRHWSYGFEPALRSTLLPSRRGIEVAVESWQDDGWARGAAALVLSTPFDSDGVAGDQGRLVRERLVEQSAAAQD